MTLNDLVLGSWPSTIQVIGAPCAYYIPHQRHHFWQSMIPTSFSVSGGYGFPNRSLEGTWRIIPFSKWLGSAPFISHKFRPFGKGPTMVMKTIYVSSWDDPPSKTRWWQLKYFSFSPLFGGRFPFWRYNIFQRGWFNHQPPKISPKNLRYCTEWCRGGPGRQCWCCDGLRKGSILIMAGVNLAPGRGSCGPHLKNKDLIRPYYIKETNG